MIACMKADEQATQGGFSNAMEPTVWGAVQPDRLTEHIDKI